MECWTEPGLRPVICWWGDWCLFVDNQRHHELNSLTRELASSRSSLPHFGELGNALNASFYLHPELTLMRLAQFTLKRTVLNTLQAIVETGICYFGTYTIVRNIIDE